MKAKPTGRPFVVGTSGNPSGRPKGSSEAAAWRTAIGADVAKVVAVVKKMALAGDLGACRLVLERCVPAYKPVEQAVTLNLPDGTLSDQAKAVVAAVAAGSLSPGQGAQLVGAISAVSGIILADDIVRRIAALEAAGGVNAQD